MAENNALKEHLNKVVDKLRNATPVKDSTGSMRYLGLDQRIELPVPAADHTKTSYADPTNNSTLAQRENARVAAKLHADMTKLSSASLHECTP